MFRPPPRSTRTDTPFPYTTLFRAPGAPSWAQQSAGAEQPVPGSADARLKALYDAEWDWRLKEEALLPNEDGRPIPADHFERVDAASQQRRLDYYTNVLAELSRIPRDQLSAEEDRKSTRLNSSH